MGRITFNGVPVSPGAALGAIYICRPAGYTIDRGTVDEYQVENEITNLEVAICKSFIEIYDLHNGFSGVLSEQELRIFDAYKAILDDIYFFQEMKDTIKTQKVHAENAIDICIQNYITLLKDSDNDYARQRIYDLSDIRNRLIKNTIGDNSTEIENISSGHIVIVQELTPSFAAALGKKNVKGVAVEDGAGYLSHSAIVLRSLGIPTLNKIQYSEIKQYHGEKAMIDGESGLLTIGHDDNTGTNSNQKEELPSVDSAGQLETPGQSAVTKDGCKIGISANISNVEEFINAAKAPNIDGIGLVRTEILFINYRKMPDERRQYMIYSKIAKTMGAKPVVIRTADIGADKILGCMDIKPEFITRNLRGISRSLEQKTQLKTQIRSIIRASQYGNISITFPMVNTAEEIRRVKGLIRDVYDELINEGQNHLGDIKIGAVIETLSAVQNIDEILKEVDFISIGTNDLLQQLMGVDRRHSTRNEIEYLHPEFLRELSTCIHKARVNGKNVSICGEMAAEPVSAVILIGMGANDLSMNPYSIQCIHTMIRRTPITEAKDLVDKVIQCNHTKEVMCIIQEWMSDRMGRKCLI